jgi:predicted signal transduction protein with EAL and GGDEF domain
VISVLMRIAEDCAQVRGLVMRLHAGDGPSDLVTSSSASRFFLNVVSPQATARFDARRRVQAVLADPSSPSMVFQPVIDLRSGAMPMVDALARFPEWDTARSPEKWFDDAYSVGLGSDLEMLALTKALEGLSALPAAVAFL